MAHAARGERHDRRGKGTAAHEGQCSECAAVRAVEAKKAALTRAPASNALAMPAAAARAAVEAAGAAAVRARPHSSAAALARVVPHAEQPLQRILRCPAHRAVDVVTIRRQAMALREQGRHAQGERPSPFRGVHGPTPAKRGWHGAVVIPQDSGVECTDPHVTTRMSIVTSTKCYRCT